MIDGLRVRSIEVVWPPDRTHLWTADRAVRLANEHECCVVIRLGAFTIEVRPGQKPWDIAGLLDRAYGDPMGGPASRDDPA